MKKGEFMENLIIEKATEENLDNILLFLANQYFDLFWQLNKNVLYAEFYDIYRNTIVESYMEEYHKKKGNVYFASIDNTIVGAGYIDSNNYLDSLFVLEEYHNYGIGSKLLERIIREVSAAKVIRVDANIKAVSLYKKFHFIEADGPRNAAFIPMELERNHYGQ